jgi:8-oxo-dGTP diphosphatase
MQSIAPELKPLHVAVGVVFDEHERILISRRADDMHQGGKWEFPGGKIEAEESVETALSRELEEELGIRVLSARPLIQIPYHYPDRYVLLDVWRVDQFEGEPEGREGQPFTWVTRELLSSYEFPAANRPIINAIELPDRVIITPAENELPLNETRISDVLAANESAMFYLRNSEGRNSDELVSTFTALRDHERHKLLSNSPNQVCMTDGWHLKSRELMEMKARPEGFRGLLSGSCHDESEVHKANALELDFILISPVQKTNTHPDSSPLGWDYFTELTRLAQMPVYALGGLGVEDIPRARSLGAQGVAGIRGFWS